MSRMLFNYLVHGLVGKQRRREPWSTFAPSALLIVGSPVPLECQCSLLHFFLHFFFVSTQPRKGSMGSEKVTARKFSFSPSSSFLVQACSLPHAETVPASVPRETLHSFVFTALRAIRLLINLVAS